MGLLGGNGQALGTYHSGSKVTFQHPYNPKTLNSLNSPKLPKTPYNPLNSLNSLKLANLPKRIAAGHLLLGFLDLEEAHVAGELGFRV